MRNSAEKVATKLFKNMESRQSVDDFYEQAVLDTSWRQSTIIKTASQKTLEEIRTPTIGLTSSIQVETVHNLIAYTNSAEKKANDWLTLNYAQVDRENSNNVSHEFEAGLGEILLDPNIQTIEIKRRGKPPKKATRSIVTTGKHNGRFAFVYKDGAYASTRTGDKFRILRNPSSKELDSKESKATFAHEQKLRLNSWKKSKDSKKIKTTARIARTHEKRRNTRSNSSPKYIPRAHATSRPPETIIDGEKTDINITTTSADYTITNETVDKAIAETSLEENEKDGFYLEDIINKPNFSKLVDYVCREIDVPPHMLYAMISKESAGRFYPTPIGDGVKSVGMCQIQPKAWIDIKEAPKKGPKKGHAKVTGKFHTIMSKFVENPDELKRGQHIVADLIAGARFLRMASKRLRYKLTYNSKPSKEKLSHFRFFYVWPTSAVRLARSNKNSDNYINAKKEYDKYKGYSKYVKIALKAQAILTQKAQQATQLAQN